MSQFLDYPLEFEAAADPDGFDENECLRTILEISGSIVKEALDIIDGREPFVAPEAVAGRPADKQPRGKARAAKRPATAAPTARTVAAHTRTVAGLPAGIFSNKKYQFGKTL
jgi:hypothetical protein